MSIRIDGTNTTANPGITGSDTDTGLQFGTDEVKVVTGGSDRVTVDSSGRLLVGTSSDTTGDTGAKVQIVDTGTPVLALSRNDTSIASGNTIGQIRIFSNDDSGYQECARIAAQADGTFANNDKPTRLVFSTTADGASSPTERMRILSSGGITFNGDTAAANALDDYEEGTWTPTVTVEGQSAATTDKQNGRYIKIGSKVTVWAYVQLNGTPTGRGVNNAWQHGGLPFPKKNDEGGFDVGGPIMYWTIDSTSALNGTAPYHLVARLFNNSSGGRIRAHDSSSSQFGQNASLLLKDNTEYAYSFTYETTA